MATPGKPEIEEGYLGPQLTFFDIGLNTKSHPDPEILSRDNHLEITLSEKNSVKVTHQLTDCKSGKDLSEYVFTQIKDGIIYFLVHMPESGWYKLQIYGLPLTDAGKSLPNVFNYLINCTKALNPVYPFPKQFAQWKNGCYLFEPLFLHRKGRLSDIKWHVRVPKAKEVAVVVDDEWFNFHNRGGPVFEAKFSLDHLKTKDKRIILSARFDGEDNRFNTLLEFHFT